MCISVHVQCTTSVVVDFETTKIFIGSLVKIFWDGSINFFFQSVFWRCSTPSQKWELTQNIFKLMLLLWAINLNIWSPSSAKSCGISVQQHVLPQLLLFFSCHCLWFGKSFSSRSSFLNLLYVHLYKFPCRKKYFN